MMVGKVLNRRCEMLIPLGPVLLLQKLVGSFQGADFGQAQMFHQTILSGSKTTLDATLGSAASKPGWNRSPTPAKRARVVSAGLTRAADPYCLPARVQPVNIESRSVSTAMA